MWYGKKAKSTLKSKARLMAEKINKNERKNKAEIITEVMNLESEDFLLNLGLEDTSESKTIIVIIFSRTVVSRSTQNIIIREKC